ncbi:MAG: hypothetical protein ACFCAD_21455, partial [Pleurocapsa sp.]
HLGYRYRYSPFGILYLFMYIHTTQAASLFWCAFRTSKARSRAFRKLLIQGRVVGAYKSGRYWLIPLHNGMPIIKKAKRGQAGTWKTAKKP